ncbi:MAG: dienelactone hydrolase family protein [Acidimicrobiales bacterium]
MPTSSALPARDDLADFDHDVFHHGDDAYVVHRSGTGPAVLVLTEMPGISPEVARLARWVRDAGMHVVMPSLFGTDGETRSVDEAVDVFRRTCVHRSFVSLGGVADTPIVGWLRALATDAHERCGGRGVGAIGMCFTGNFVLGMVLEPPTTAVVMCQPSLPLDRPDETGCTDDELVGVRRRLEHDGCAAALVRFEGDRWSNAERARRYREALGERLAVIELPDACANPTPPPFFADVVGCAHSVLTAHLVDEQGHPTLAARDAVLAFLRRELGVGPG